MSYCSIKFSNLPFFTVGCLVHTESPKGKKAYAYIDLYQYPHDSNLTGNVLLQILRQHCPLPSCLYLQFDNCYRENKNKFIFGLCALLVELKIVKKVSIFESKKLFLLYIVYILVHIQVKVNFLPVGHTHEDVDQLFSRISGHLKKQGAESLQGMHLVLRKYMHVQ